MKSGWTPERRACQAMAIQKWTPWQRSTGPRTPEGKAVVSRNAFKGGRRLMLRNAIREMRKLFDANAAILERIKERQTQ